MARSMGQLPDRHLHRSFDRCAGARVDETPRRVDVGYASVVAVAPRSGGNAMERVADSTSPFEAAVAEPHARMMARGGLVAAPAL